MRSMGSFDLDGKRISFEEGDTLASAMFRSGVRTFNRSLKYHRRRGLYCATGDCPNCICTVDGSPGVRTCVTPATDGTTVKRENGWPSTERDLLNVADRAGHRFMPVGFYYKVFAKPRRAWEMAERIIRRATGVGSLPKGATPRLREARNLHTDVLVVGAGIAGLQAAIAAASDGSSVVICDEGSIGEKIPPGSARDLIDELKTQLPDSVEVLERTTAIGLYEGPMVPLVSDDATTHCHPSRVVIATGAAEAHAVFQGNDLPGVWLGRGAARTAGVHGVRPGSRAVVWAGTSEALEHISVLRDSGVEIAAVVLPKDLNGEVPGASEVFRGGKVVAAQGRKQVSAAVVETDRGTLTIPCDTLVVSVGLSPRDSLLRMAGPVERVAGAGDVVWPGCSIEEAVESGILAGRDGKPETREAELQPAGSAGYVCLCEDVSIKDLQNAWDEGWRSSEILKRYTTATMGPCQGAMCGRHLAKFASPAAALRDEGSPKLTTARPPARTVRLEDLAGGVHEVMEKRSALHERHLAAGARLDWSGPWKRPFNYGDWKAEYKAVREAVSLMDVSTLGKFLIAGPDATDLVDRVFPTRVRDLAPGRSRYMITLDEAGYFIDDGLLCALEGGRWYLTSTSGGADRMEALLRNWVDRLDLDVRLLNQTAMTGSINVAGPMARELLGKLSDDRLDAEAFPYPGHREITVAGVPCRAMRVGFVGELSYELHHPRSRSVLLWDALMDAGADMGIRPHGLDALELLRMEKGHPYLLQDTLPDDHPTKLRMDWAVDMSKPSFVGKMALERMSDIPVARKLVGLKLATDEPQRGVPLYTGDQVVGRLTSCSFSPMLSYSIGLGWVRADGGGNFPSVLRAGESVEATVVPTPFYDPEGGRMRG